MSLLQRLVLVSTAALLVSCTSSWYGHRFVPAPIEVELSVEGEPTAQARALVSVRGIRRAVPKEQQPVQLEARMRIENLGESPVALEEEGLELVAADLQSFGRARVTPPPGAPIAPGDSVVYDIVFPLPAGKDLKEFDLRGLNLKWVVSFDGRRTTTGITFERFVPPRDYYGDPFYPRTHIGVGFVGHFHDD